MTGRFTLAFFGSSLVSAYWNGAATYYRGMIRAFHACGHQVRFYEPDACDRLQHRDMPDPPWARVVVYSGTDASAMRRALDEARDADVVVKASGRGRGRLRLLARPHHYRGHDGGTPRRRARMACLDSVARESRLAVDDRSRRFAVVPDCAVVPAQLQGTGQRWQRA